MSIPILHTQFSPPAIKDSFIRKADLFKKLNHIQQYPLTLLHSGAGYGKSTALSLYVHQSSLPTCWYSISTYDDDFVPFLTKLIHAIKAKYPTFGEGLIHELELLENYVHDQEVWSLMTMVVNDISRLEEELIIVLDDFHHVKHSHAIGIWMEQFIEHLPRNIHLVISSRNRPNWKSLTNLKVKGECYEIEQKDLVFTIEEMEHLLVDVYELDFNEKNLKEIHALTEGWAIAFSMIIQHLKAGQETSTILDRDNRTQSLQDLFDYLAHEVLSKQAPIVQKFLEQASVLDVLSPEACDVVLGMSGSKELLEDLAQRNLFLQAIDYNHYRFHALFQVFLENRIKKAQPEEYQQRHEQAARFYERKGDIETAIRHLEKIHHYARVGQLLSEHGHSMLQIGKLQSLYDRIQKISEREKNYFPILWYYEGEVLRYKCAYKESEACYEAAINNSKKKGDLKVESLGYEGKARIYLDTIQPDQAERILQSAIEIREKLDAPKEEKSRLYQLLAENLLNAGQASKAESWFKKALELNIPLESGNLAARLYLRTGRLEMARNILMKRKKEIPFNESKHLPQSHRETDILLSIIEGFMGNSEGSKLSAQAGIEQGMKVQSPFVEACGWIRLGHAVQLINRYEPSLAEKCYITALEMMEKINVSRGKAEPYMGLCILYGMQTEYEKAIEMGQKGLNETEKVKDLWLSALIQLCMGISSIYCKQYEKAKYLINEVEVQFKQCGDLYGMMLVVFWKAYMAYELNDEATFKIEIKRFLQQVQAGQFDFFFKKRTNFGPIDLQNFVPLLLAAQKHKIHEHFVTKVIYDLGYGETKNHPGYTLRIQTLGEMKVWLGKEEVKEKDWQRGKAKELFELFVTKRHHLIPREEIFQALWRDQDEEGANRSFKVSLNALLKTLEPNRKARAEAFFIKRIGSAYGLNAKSGYELDLSIFESWLTAGLDEKDPHQAKQLLEKGLKLYEGDFLPERQLEDWCLNERERLQVLFLRGAEKVAQVSVRLQAFDDSIYWCERILEKDNTWEEAYRLLMYSYYQKNNRPQSLKWYQKCCEALDNELGVEPMKPTKDMYKIVKEANEILF